MNKILDQLVEDKYGYSMSVLKAVESVNEKQKTVLFEKLYNYYEGNLKGKTIALWGLAFKPETDDMREATSLVTIKLLLKEGCKVVVYDPIAMQECMRRIGEVVTYANNMYDCVFNADALLLLTEWKIFRLPKWNVLKERMVVPLLIDGRNLYDHNEVISNGIIYMSIGS